MKKLTRDEQTFKPIKHDLRTFKQAWMKDFPTSRPAPKDDPFYSVLLANGKKTYYDNYHIFVTKNRKWNKEYLKFYQLNKKKVNAHISDVYTPIN